MKKLFTDGQTHAQMDACTMDDGTKCDHKSSPCHYVTG